MQISRHWRLNSQRYGLEGSRSKEGGGYSIQPVPTPVLTEGERRAQRRKYIREHYPVDPRVQEVVAAAVLGTPYEEDKNAA